MRLIHHVLGSRLELLVVYFFTIGAASLFVGSAAFAYVLWRGGATTFPPSESRLGYVSGPDTRGTLDIIETCVSTIFTCVYVSVHLDVPNSARDDIFEADLYRTRAPRVALRAFFIVWRVANKPGFRRIVWMIFNVFAPELVIFIALLERMSAKAGMEYMRSRGHTEWTMALAYFADMGGFELEDGTILSTGVEFYTWFSRNNPILDFRRLRREIADRSKANVVIKLYTVSQAGWFLVTTVARLIDKRAVSELEVTTSAYIFCTVTVYWCWLHKPYDVGRRIVLYTPGGWRHGIPSFTVSSGMTLIRPQSVSVESRIPHPHLSEGALSVPRPSSNVSVGSNPPTASAHTLREPSPAHSIPIPILPYDNPRLTPFNRAFQNPDRDWSYASSASGIVGMVVGVIHCILWNQEFINTTGKWLWRLCCVAQIALPFMIAAVWQVEKVYVGRPLFAAMLLMVFVYGITRTMLFALIGLSFWSLPATVYTDIDWSWSFPHWH